MVHEGLHIQTQQHHLDVFILGTCGGGGGGSCLSVRLTCSFVNDLRPYVQQTQRLTVFLLGKSLVSQRNWISHRISILNNLHSVLWNLLLWVTCVSSAPVQRLRADIKSFSSFLSGYAVPRTSLTSLPPWTFSTLPSLTALSLLMEFGSREHRDMRALMSQRRPAD